MRKRVAVVGGGIAGLAAAVRLRDRAPGDIEIIVYEQSGVLGGKLRTGELGGVAVERGAESFLVGAPDGGESAAVAFIRRLGLADALVHPAAVPAALAIGGRLVPVPAGTLIGVPGDLAALGGVAEPAVDADHDGGRPLLADGEDVAVGALVRARYGDQVADRLVDPMLGGVYAGRADALSLAATMPALAAAARTEHTLAAAVRAAQAAQLRTPGRPVFGAVAGGMSRLIAAAAAAGAARISLGLPVRGLSRTPHGWRLLFGPVPAAQTDDVDAVVLAVPAQPAARLLGGVDAAAARATGGLAYASVALIGFALPPGTPLPELSGFLVPATEGTLVKAATFITRKWPHLTGGRPDPAGGSPGSRRDGNAVIGGVPGIGGAVIGAAPGIGSAVIVRASLGRAGEEERLQRDDAVLAAQAHAELATLIGDLPPATAWWLQRWGGGLPQYAPGHVERVAEARSSLPPGLALAGAAYDGVGIPACVASGERAADDLVKYLED